MFFNKIPIVHQIIRIAVTGLLSGVALSWPLWNPAERSQFPLLPLWGEAENPHLMRGLLHVIGWSGLFVLSIGAFVFTGKKLFTGLLSGWLVVLCAFDLNRLQPWVWFYLLVFSANIFGKKENEAPTINALRWLLAGVYFWSGFNKLTPYYAEDNFAWFCEAFDFAKPFGQFPALGYAVALLEMFFSAGLLWGKTRPYFRWIVVVFHAVIIIFLIKLDWNWVVIPWNLTMAGMVWVLNPSPSPSPAGSGIALFGALSADTPLPAGEGLGLGLTWLAPLLYFFNLWPYTLSWQMYSNTQPEATYYRDKNPMFATIEEELMWEGYGFDDRTKLLLDDWAMDELKVPAFASKRTFYQIGKYLIKSCNDDRGVYILTVHRWDKSAEKMEKIPCREFNK